MKFQHRWTAAAFFIGMLAVSSFSNAALISRLNGQAVYDTDLNITWLADANLAASNTFGVSGVGSSGAMADWNTALNWIDGMNAANYLGYSDWRLPTLRPLDGISFRSGFPDDLSIFDGSADISFNVSAPGTLYAGSTAGEMSHLYYNTLGNLGYFDTSGNPEQPGWGLQSTGPFSNLQPTIYWYGVGSNNSGWFFQFDIGFQGGVGNFASVNAWAVRTGDVAAVPVPAAVWFFGSGMLGLLGIARHKTV